MLGGKAKRKKLLSPKGMNVRPMMEVVKGSAFDILQVVVIPKCYSCACVSSSKFVRGSLCVDVRYWLATRSVNFTLFFFNTTVPLKIFYLALCRQLVAVQHL